MQSKQEVRRITLGTRKQGIKLVDLDGHEWHFHFNDRFAVVPDRQFGVLLLHNEKRFRLFTAGGKEGRIYGVYIEMYGRVFLFQPFLRIDWLREMLHYYGK